MVSEAIKQMLDTLPDASNTERYKLECVRIVERIRAERDSVNTASCAKGTGSHFGPGIWNQRKSKFDTSCGGCGTFLEAKTLCWITVGDSPRCLECGKPHDNPEDVCV